MQKNIESLELERRNIAVKLADLQVERQEAPSAEIVENMKRELRILKKLEYNVTDNDSHDPGRTRKSNYTETSEEETLETVLIAKLRKMEGELLKERRETIDCVEKCKGLESNIFSLKQAKNDADALVTRLENDLDKAITSPLTSSTHNSAFLINTQADPETLQSILDPSSLAPESSPNQSSISKVSPVIDKKSDDHSVATIVMAQRDRLRARCDTLESERDNFKQELQVQVSSADTLKSDNTKLYEKVRYLQNYNKNHSNGQSSIAGVYLRNKVAIADHDLDLEAMDQRYETSVDPFRQFSRAERQRKFKEMSPMEQVVFIVAKTVLGSKETRNFLFFYVLGMHLLVFTTTYHWSHEKGCNLHDHADLSSFHGGPPLIESEN